MSLYNAYKRYLDDLYFNMLEYFTFEKEFTSNLSKNFISSYVICLVDAEEIETWKSLNSYDSCVEFFENCDNINFEKFQIELLNQNQNVKKNIKKFDIYETLDEVCHSLKKGKRISLIGNQFLCYVNKITYTKKCFKCYTKNNNLIIYFGDGKSFFIPNFFINKILDSENVFIVDLPEDKNCFIEAIFDNNNQYQNMYESIKSCQSKTEKNFKMNMTNLLSYDVDSNELKKFKNYNFYINEDEKNNNDENQIMYQQGGDVDNINLNLNYENYNLNNNNDIIYNYNNNYYINYVDNGKSSNIVPSYIDSNNAPQYQDENYKDQENQYNEMDNNININDYPRDTNENINKSNTDNNKYINNQNYIPEEAEKENIDSNNNLNKEIISEKEQNEIKEKDEQNNYIEIENQNQEEPGKDILKSDNLNDKEIIENKDKEENNKHFETESQNQIEQKKETFNLNDINNQETNPKKEEELKNKEKEKSGQNSYMDTESQNQIDQEKENFYINYINNQKTNPELKDLDIIPKDEFDNNKNTEKNFSIKNIKRFPTLGLDNISGNNSYINSSLQCLINTIPFVNFFLGGKNINKIPEEDDDNNINILTSFLQIMKKLWTNDDTNIKSINPEKFINRLKQLSSSFNIEEENDIGELILYLIEQISSELKDNAQYKEENISIIYNTFFEGENELTSECLKCLNNKENEIEKIVENKGLYYLAFRLNDVLDYLKDNKIKENNNINIYDCLNFFECPKIAEPNGKICEKCGNKEEFLITSKIKKCQNNILILLNKNFNKEEDIKFELNEILEMKNIIKNNENQEELNYYLYAIICLNITFGENKNIIHHVAFCKSPVDSLWYKYDDDVVEPVVNLESEVEKIDMPVALFYQKCADN